MDLAHAETLIPNQTRTASEMTEQEEGQPISAFTFWAGLLICLI